MSIVGVHLHGGLQLLAVSLRAERSNDMFSVIFKMILTIFFSPR